MTSIIGAVLTSSACAALGFAYAERQKAELALTEGFKEFFAYLLLRIPSLELMEDIVAEFENSALDRGGFLPIIKDINSGGTCNKRYLAAIELFSGDKPLYAALLQAGKHLGGTEYSLQLSNLQSAHDRIGHLCEKRRADFAAGEKCYRWLGVLMGAALSILLL